MATATNVRLIRQEEKHGELVQRLRVYTFTLDVGTIGPSSTDTSTATLPGVKFAEDFVLGVKHGSDYDHGLLHELHIGGDDTLHIMTHNTTGGNIDPPSDTWTVIIAKLRI